MKRFAVTVIFIIVLSLALGLTLAGCAPLADVPLQNNSPRTFRVYVCGAVQNEGYVIVTAGTNCGEAVRLAGLLPQSFLPDNVGATIGDDTKLITVNWYNGAVHSCVNANSPLIALRSEVEGISPEVINLLADYIEANGTIHNKTQLRCALGELAEQWHYKFFVAPEDYEEVC